MLDAITQSLDVVVPQVIRQLRPSAAPPPTEVKPPPETPIVTEQKPPPETKPPETKPPETKPPLVEQQPKLEPSKHPWAWAPAAGGAVFAGVGTVFYLQAKDKYDLLKTGGTPGKGDLDGDQLVREGRRAQNLSRVAFGVGAAGVVTSVVLYLLPAKESPPVTPTVTVGPGGSMVGLAGTLP
jgi:hypothetical protein